MSSSSSWTKDDLDTLLNHDSAVESLQSFCARAFPDRDVCECMNTRFAHKTQHVSDDEIDALRAKPPGETWSQFAARMTVKRHRREWMALGRETDDVFEALSSRNKKLPRAADDAAKAEEPLLPAPIVTGCAATTSSIITAPLGASPVQGRWTEAEDVEVRAGRTPTTRTHKDAWKRAKYLGACPASPEKPEETLDAFERHVLKVMS